MRGYLLDTNIIEYWFNSTRKGGHHQAVCAHIDQLPDDAPLMISAVAVGEIEYGYHVAPAKQVLKVEAVREFVRRQLPRVLDIRKTTAEVYGDLKARLFEKHAWRHRKTKIRRPEELIDDRHSIQETTRGC